MSSQRLSSSPLSSLPSSQPNLQNSKPSSTYRTAQLLPFELLQHVQVYFEEQLLNQAFRFLLSLLTSSMSNSRPILIPPPDYLAVIATFCIHPSLTTRTTARDKWSNANSALKYLRIVNKIIGPVNSRLNEAFVFRKYTDGIVAVTKSEEEEDVNNNKLSISCADTDSLFYLAEDFWALVGWALNCSCLPGSYATRWDYYAPYLDYMLDMLETDWSTRERNDDLDNSLVWLYVKSSIGGNARGRRILRAVFADGGEASLNEFREVFRKELKSPKSDADKIKKQEVVVDVDEEIYGDWMQDDGSESEEEHDTMQDIRSDSIHERQSKRLRTRTPSARRRVKSRTSRKSLLVKTLGHDDSDVSMPDVLATRRSLGGVESIIIRLRLMSLLIDVSKWTELVKSSEDLIFPDLQELYTLFVEFIRPLPLNAFQQLILPHKPITGRLTSPIDPEKHNLLCEFILQRTIDRAYHQIITFEPMTPARLVTDYLPLAAYRNSAEAQAKVSLLLESVVRRLSKESSVNLKRSTELVEAFEKGVAAREAKAEEAVEGRKKLDNNEEDLARLMLTESGMRMKLTIDALEESTV